MKIFALFVMLSVTFGCNGHLSTFTDILSGAHKHVHSTAQGVASTLLGGFNLNFGISSGVQAQRKPPPPSNGPPETVIVIVKEQNNENGQSHGQQPYGPQNNYNNQNTQYRPEQNSHGQEDYHNGYNNNGYSNQNQGNYQRPNENPNQNNYGNGNQNAGQNNNEGSQGIYGRPPSGDGSQNNYGRPSQNVPDENQENDNSGAGRPQWPVIEDKPSTHGSVYNPSTESSSQNNEKTTAKSDDPLFVPLHPNEYVYGGDKITVNAPKRETDDTKPIEDEYVDSPIDIRFQNQ